MFSVKSDNLQCWSDSARFTSAAEWGGEFVFLSLFGPRNAVRAVWARLVGSKYGSVEIGERTATLGNKGSDAELRYTTISAPISKATLHLTIIEQKATNQVSPFSSSFYEVSPNPRETFFPRLNRMCPVPFRQSWRERIWELGLESGLISPLPGFGLPGYSISTIGQPKKDKDGAEKNPEDPNWSRVIQAAVRNGDLV